jgi:hypothetical protein
MNFLSLPEEKKGKKEEGKTKSTSIRSNHQQPELQAAPALLVGASPARHGRLPFDALPLAVLQG